MKCDSYTDEDRELEKDLEQHQIEDEFYEHDWALKIERDERPELRQENLKLDDAEDLVDTQEDDRVPSAAPVAQQ